MPIRCTAYIVEQSVVNSKKMQTNANQIFPTRLCKSCLNIVLVSIHNNKMQILYQLTKGPHLWCLCRWQSPVSSGHCEGLQNQWWTFVYKIFHFTSVLDAKIKNRFLNIFSLLVKSQNWRFFFQDHAHVNRRRCRNCPGDRSRWKPTNPTTKSRNLHHSLHFLVINLPKLHAWVVKQSNLYDKHAASVGDVEILCCVVDSQLSHLGSCRNVRWQTRNWDLPKHFAGVSV